MSRHAYWFAAIIFALLVLTKFDSQSGFTSLIRFGGNWQQRRLSALQGLPVATIPGSNGYDGQFYAQIGLDPLLQGAELAGALDAPAYRARRILLPAAAAGLGLGRPWWVLQTYALLNVLCWFFLGWCLRTVTLPDGWPGLARWAGCMFGMGVLDSVRQSLVDLPALLLLLLAITSESRAQFARTGWWLALGNLTKETTLLGSLALQSAGLASNLNRKRSLAVLLFAGAPIGIWSFYVQLRLGGNTAGAGLGNFDWPLTGLFAHTILCFAEILHGNFNSRYSFGFAAVVGLATQFLVIWRQPDFKSAWWRVGAAYSLLLPLLGPWVWTGYWAACRALLPMTVAFNLLLPVNRSFWPLWLIGNLTMLHAIWRFL